MLKRFVGYLPFGSAVPPWLSGHHLPERRANGWAVYEHNSEAETFTTLQGWVNQLRDDLKDFINGRPAWFYDHLHETKDGQEIFFRELERIEWLHEGMKALLERQQTAAGNQHETSDGL